MQATLATTKGPVDSPVALPRPASPRRLRSHLVWSTVVGNRVNCTSTCWAFVSQPLGIRHPFRRIARRQDHGPRRPWRLARVQLVQNGKVVAQVPFYVMASIVGAGVSSLTVKEGQPFTIHLKGIGWTQLDNTVGVDYDNSYMGYGCGFNSNGDVLLNLVATGGVGTHLIDLYPMLYSLSPSFANTPYGMVPMLTYAQDNPGWHSATTCRRCRFAINVVK